MYENFATDPTVWEEEKKRLEEDRRKEEASTKSGASTVSASKNPRESQGPRLVDKIYGWFSEVSVCNP